MRCYTARRRDSEGRSSRCCMLTLFSTSPPSHVPVPEIQILCFCLLVLVFVCVYIYIYIYIKSAPPLFVLSCLLLTHQSESRPLRCRRPGFWFPSLPQLFFLRLTPNQAQHHITVRCVSVRHITFKSPGFTKKIITRLRGERYRYGINSKSLVRVPAARFCPTCTPYDPRPALPNVQCATVAYTGAISPSLYYEKGLVLTFAS